MSEADEGQVVGPGPTDAEANDPQEVIQGILAGAGVEPQTVEAVVAVFEQTRGPFPPPSMLAGYERTLRGAADRIFTLAEQQSAHRQELEKMSVQRTLALRERGQLFAFIIAMSALVAGAVLIGLDKNIEGLVLIIGAVATIVGTFITGRFQQQRGNGTGIGNGNGTANRS